MARDFFFCKLMRVQRKNKKERKSAVPQRAEQKSVEETEERRGEERREETGRKE